MKPTHVALLRGVNLGGHKRVAMSDLRSLAESLGFLGVGTVLQSGNLLFRSEAARRTEIEERLREATALALGLDVEFFARTADEWRLAIESNPFPGQARDDPARLALICLKQDADPAEVSSVVDANTGPEQIRAVGDTLYVTYPDGMGNSKLATTPGWRTLGGAGTARNWNTVLKILDLFESR